MGSLVGAKLGHFRLDRVIGTGGMGVVYAATDERLERTVAVKVVKEQLDSPATRKRFLREARLAAKLTHPHIATVFEVGEMDAHLYIVMELLEGLSLRRWMNGRRMSIEQALGIARDVARGLARAHAEGIAHRDIKPENVFVTQPSPGALHAKVLDFGLARQDVSVATPGTVSAEHTTTTTRVGAINGTPGYWSPEQAAGSSVDLRSDIFSFGVVLYEMLTGKRAFAAEHAVAQVVLVTRSEPEPLRALAPQVPPDVVAIVERCLRKDPEERYVDGTHLCAELERVLRVFHQGAAYDPSLDEPTFAGRGDGPSTPIAEASTILVTPQVASAPPPHPPAAPTGAAPSVEPPKAPVAGPAIPGLDAFRALPPTQRLAVAIGAGVAAAIAIVVIVVVALGPKRSGPESSLEGPRTAALATVSASMPDTQPGPPIVRALEPDDPPRDAAVDAAPSASAPTAKPRGKKTTH
ncbi:MAG: serine/threonine protein kinase [Deltaproteobacteria bacterium]|nr:serine/threonine protein kinase [Deltaproteobacteria bacterium]